MRTIPPSHSLILAALMLATLSPLAAQPGYTSTQTSSSAGAQATVTPAQIRAFFNSPDYKARNRTDAEFINDVFQTVLRRSPDPKGFNDWLSALNNSRNNAAARQSMVNRVLKSSEYAGIQAASAAPKLPKKDTTRNPANVLFDKTGVFVNDAGALPVDVYAARLKMANVTWISLQIDNGGKVREDNAAAIARGWADQWRAQGFKVGFWGCPRGITQHDRQSAVAESIPIVQADAQLAVKLVVKYRADFYLADVEAPYQGFSPTDPAVLLSRYYVEAYKKAAAEANITSMPRALSSMGRIALDMKPWIDEGWDAMPQAYWNSYAVYQPSKCVDFYVETGWPIARIHPTIATYTGEGENRTVTLDDYAKDLKTRNTTGFSYYLPESYLRTNDALYTKLAEMAGR